jgi:hypothetical protein
MESEVGSGLEGRVVVTSNMGDLATGGVGLLGVKR